MSGKGEGDRAELDQAVWSLTGRFAVEGDEAKRLERRVGRGARRRRLVLGIIDADEGLAVGWAQAGDEPLAGGDRSAAPPVTLTPFAPSRADAALA